MASSEVGVEGVRLWDCDVRRGQCGRRQQLDSCTKLAHRRIDRCDSIPAVGVPFRGACWLELPSRLIRFVRQVEQHVRELFRLADEEPVIREALSRGDGAAELC
jgi:hypothetical protein